MGFKVGLPLGIRLEAAHTFRKDEDFSRIKFVTRNYWLHDDSAQRITLLRVVHIIVRKTIP